MSMFASVPVEEGTRVTFQVEARFGDHDVLYQKWVWDGVRAESLIFVGDEVSGLSDAQLEAELRSSPLAKPGSQVTVSRSASGFTFVNFNFTTED